MHKPIFISYKRADKTRVFEIKDFIQSQTGISCWIDLDGIESDAQFASVIIKAINECELFLFMYSEKHGMIVDYENDWTIRELCFAQSKNKRIVFINIDGCKLTDWFDLIFGTKQQIDACDDGMLMKLCIDISYWFGYENDSNSLGKEENIEISPNKYSIIDVNKIARESLEKDNLETILKQQNTSWKSLFKSRQVFLDVGSLTTKILFEGEIIYNDYSYVIFENRTSKCTAIGKDAFKQLDRSFMDVTCICPINEGVFYDYDAAMIMLKSILNKCFKPMPFNFNSHRIVIAIPCGITEIEKEGFRSVLEKNRFKKIKMIESTFCIAASFGLNIKNHEAYLIADIGYSKTGVSVIYNGQILFSKHIIGAGKRITKSLKDFLRIKHELVVSESFSELLKTVLFKELVSAKDSASLFRFTGVDLKTNNVKSVDIPQKQIMKHTNEACYFIRNAIRDVIAQVPDELRLNIVENEIYLSGGSALLIGLKETIQEDLNIRCHVSSHPQFDILMGAYELSKNPHNDYLFSSY